MAELPKEGESIREVVAVLDTVEDMEKALSDLQSANFDRAQISLLAREETARERLAHLYRDIEAAEDDPKAPRAHFVSSEEQGLARGVLIGGFLYVGAVAATGLVLASGGTLAAALAAAAAAGVGAARRAGCSARCLSGAAPSGSKSSSNGAASWWVTTATPEQEARAMEILKRYSAHDVHAHRMPPPT